MKRIIGALVLGALVFLSCQKQQDNTPTLTELRLLGDPVPQADFQSTGRFRLNLLALDDENNVIDLGDDQVTMILDSVTAGKLAYTITVVDVSYVRPSVSGKIKVALLLDSSGSMDWNDPNYLRVSASRDFIRLLLSNNSSHKAGVFDFASDAYGYDNNGDGIDDYYLRVLQDFVYVSDTVHLFQALDSVTAWGGTPLYLSLWHLLDYVHARVESGYGHAILVLTDGEDNESYDITSDSVIAKAQNYQIPIYAIGLGDTSYIDFTEMRRIASSTGGVFANAFDADGLNLIFNSMGFGLSQGYSRIIARINPIPPSGSIIYGRTRVISGGNALVRIWQFEAP